MVASFVLTLVMSGVMVCYLWCGAQASLTAKTGWSQNMALRTSGKLMDFIRNAQAISAIDEVEGTWVDLATTSGTVRLVYSNAVNALRDGRMYLQMASGSETVVSRGLTEVMDTGGNTEPVFYVDPYNRASNVLQVALRVSEPTSSGTREADDDDFAVCVRFSVLLRNAPSAHH